MRITIQYPSVMQMKIWGTIKVDPDAITLANLQTRILNQYLESFPLPPLRPKCVERASLIHQALPVENDDSLKILLSINHQFFQVRFS